MSESTERARVVGALRVAGVLALLVVQGGGALTFGLLAYHHRQASARPAGAHDELPAAIGSVALFGDAGFTVMTPVEMVDVRIDERTVVITQAGAGSLSDLRPGATVIVSGHAEGRHLVRATSIRVSPGPAP
jgi:hypothetical protein